MRSLSLAWLALAACTTRPSHDTASPLGCPTPTIDGPAPSILAAHLGAPWALAADGDGVVVSLFAGGTVARVDRAGAMTPLATIANPTGIAIDGTNVYVGTSALGDEGVAPLVVVDRTTGATTTIAAAEPSPGTLRIANGFLYWIDSGTAHGIIDSRTDPYTPNGDAAVMRVALAGGTPQRLYGGEDWISDLAIDGDTLYVAATTGGRGRVIAMALDGSGATDLVDAPQIYGIAANAGAVYWTMPGACVVQRSVAGGAPETIADGENWPMRIVADARGVTWTNEGIWGTGYAGSAVIRAGIDGGNRRVLAAARGAYAVIDAPGAVYFTDDTLDGDVGVVVEP